MTIIVTSLLLVAVCGCSQPKTTVPPEKDISAVQTTDPRVDPVDLAKQFVKSKGFDKWLDLNSATRLKESETHWTVSFVNPDSKAAGEQPYTHYFAIDKKSLKVEPQPID